MILTLVEHSLTSASMFNCPCSRATDTSVVTIHYKIYLPNLIQDNRWKIYILVEGAIDVLPPVGNLVFER